MKRLLRLLPLLMTLTLLTLYPKVARGQVMFLGTKMVTLKGGIPYRSTPFYTPNSFRAGVEYAQFLKGGDYWSIALDVEQNRVPSKEFYIDDHTFMVSGGYNLFIIGDFSRHFNLYGFTGLSMGYELFNKDVKELPDGELLSRTQAFIYGGKVGLHADVYLTDQLALNFGLGTHLLWGSVTNTIGRPYFEGGIKISFY